MGDAPLLVVSVDDADIRKRLDADLSARFAPMFDVVAGVVDEAAAMLDAFADRGRRVAAVIAAPPHVDRAVEDADVLGGVRRWHPDARRILLVGRGQWRGHPVRQAMALGRVDSYLFHPWSPREQWLYLPMSEQLAEWSRSQPPEQVAFTIVGAPGDPRSHELRDAMTRGAIPFAFHPPTSPAGRALLRRVGQDGSRLPVLEDYTGKVLVQPTDADLVEALGFRRRARDLRCDVAVVGAGPSGLSAAVYAASEGLSTVIIDPGVPGGQAGTSSMIRNYLGFPRGVSGSDLASRAIEQAWLFGAEMLLSVAVVGMEVDGTERTLVTSDGGRLTTRAVVLAMGVGWRRLRVPALVPLVGAGVFYGAAATEADAMRGRQVAVVGGGNSAGQAALHLARHAAGVTMVIRRDSLAETMSDYLVREIGDEPAIAVRPGAEVVDAVTDGVLRALVLRDRRTGAESTMETAALFVMIGAAPRTDWLDPVVARDADGFVLTGHDLPLDAWPLSRPPTYLETNVPGVFAVGDVRHGSTKRVASAVGAGAIAVHLVHEYLAGQA